MTRTFFDANFLLESLLPQRAKTKIATDLLAVSHVVISPLTAHLFVHFGKKEKFSIEKLTNIIIDYDITQMSREEILWAMTNRQSDDFEDALQVACAVLAGCDEFITFDSPLAKNYSRFIKITVPK